MAFLRRKITLVVLGALLVGGAGAMLGAKSAVQPSSSSSQVTLNGSNGGSSGAPTATNGGNPTGTTPTASIGARPTNTSVPTATPTRVPPAPTATFVSGQTETIHGSVANGSINTSLQTFVLNTRGGSFTCQVAGTTSWSGAATGLSGTTALQPGMQATVTGIFIFQGGNTINPVNTVYSQPADN